VPTFAELGYKDFLASSWTGVFARAGTPDAIVERMNHEINEAMKDEDVKKRMQSLGLLITMRSQKDTAAFFKDEISRWATMVEATGLSM
jgi:tripartite-type tricarboxylate transporter receptor subunit TctC